MTRPLVICDCDEVLLYFVGPFRDYLQDAHALTLTMDSFALAGNIRHANGDAVGPQEFPALLNGFFDAAMPTQMPTAGAQAALATLAEHCDIVILTNVADQHQATRAAELVRHGMPYRVVSNQGPKGRPVATLLAEYGIVEPGATRAVFIDDLPPHHSSVKNHAPHAYRLHMVADPILWPLIPAAPDADARIDHWDVALPHIRSVLGV
jgi:hypothetical protein